MDARYFHNFGIGSPPCHEFCALRGNWQQKTGTNARVRRATSAAVFMIMIENTSTSQNYGWSHDS